MLVLISRSPRVSRHLHLQLFASPFPHPLPNTPYLPPKILEKTLSLVSLGRTVISRKMGKKKVMQNFLGQTRCIMGDVEMANGERE